MKWQRWTVMLSYQSQNLEICLLYHFEGDSTLVPQTVKYVRN